MPKFKVSVEATYFRTGFVEVEADDGPAAQGIIDDIIDDGDDRTLDIEWTDEYIPDDSGLRTTGDVGLAGEKE